MTENKKYVAVCLKCRNSLKGSTINQIVLLKSVHEDNNPGHIMEVKEYEGN